MEEVSILLGGLVRKYKAILWQKRVVLETPGGRVGFPRWALIPEGEGSYYRLHRLYQLTPEQRQRLESACVEL